MRILLTGAGGFLGREIARELRARGVVVAGLVRHADQSVGPQDFVGDFLRPDTYAAQISAFAPDVLIHCAWSGVPAATRDLSSQYDNVAASVALFEHALEAGAKRLIGLGTQAEYGLTTAPVNEDAPTRPLTHYGIAKQATGAALMRLAQRRSTGAVWLRLFGLYGPRETAPSMLPWVARQFAQGQVPALTPCTQRWDYLHVRDAARAVCDLLPAQTHGVFNLASGHAPPLRETVLKLRDLMAPKITPDFGAVPFGPEQVHCLAGDISRLQAATGWAPQVTLEEGLAELATEAFGALAS